MRLLAQLFAVFTGVTLIEMFLLLQLGALMGPLWTFLVVLITGFIGAWLARREGLAVLQSMREDLSQGLPPASRVVEGVLVLCGSLLLVTPGVLTDFVGFALIFPFSRQWAAPRIVNWAAKKLEASDAVVTMNGVNMTEARPAAAGADPFHDSRFDD